MKKVIITLVAATFIAADCNGQTKNINTMNSNNKATMQDSLMISAITGQDVDFLNKNLTPENVNKQYDVPVGILHITYSDGESDKPIFGKGSLLHLAAFHNLPDAARILIEKGADVEAKDSEGRTPLQAAVIAYSYRTTEAQKTLIENGANMNFYTNQGVPLLYQYIWYENFDLAELAIANGADVNMKTKDGDTILEFAERRGTPEIVSMLKAKGATK